MRKDGLKGLAVAAFQFNIVPLNGTW
jgi:hypothetical protein